MKYQKWSALALWLWLISGQAVQASEEITLYTYHNHPPFINQPGEGLSYDLADLLSEQSAGAFQFTVKVVPRSRLNVMLKSWVNGECIGEPRCTRNWVVPWVNQKWGFGKAPEQNFSWTPLLEDSNVIVSRSDAPVEYRQPSDLDGKRFAGIGGHRYVGIDERAEAGKITRINGTKERDNLIILARGRVDATLLPASTYRYYLKQDRQLAALSSRLYRAKQPHQAYTRNLMASGDQQKLNSLLTSLRLQQNSGWHELLDRYGLVD